MSRRTAAIAPLLAGVALLGGCQAVAGLGDFAPDDGAGSAGGAGGAPSVSSAGGTSAQGGGGSTSTSSSASTTTTSSTGAGSCATDHLVLSEVRTRGPDNGNQDFIEILNPTSRTIVLDASFRVESRGESASSYNPRWTGDGTLTMGPGQRVLLANSAVPSGLGGAEPDALYGSGVPDGASVVLYEGDVVVDAMCFTCEKDSLGDGYVCEGSPLTRSDGCSASGDRSVQRRAAGGVDGCADTDESAADLVDREPSTPTGLSG